MSTLKKLFKKFQNFIKPYKQPIRGFLGWLFGMLAQVTAVGVDTVMTWDVKRWAFTLAIASLPGFMGFMRGGDNNPTDEELYEKVKTVKQARIAQGLAVTGEHPLPPAEKKP